MIIDAHLHCTGDETASDVLDALDEADIDIGVLIAPFLHNGYTLADPIEIRRANEHLSRLVRGHEDRLFGLAVVNPSLPGAADELRHAVETLGLRGAKMVPSGWYPESAIVQPTFAVASELKLPLLFHSGVFIDGRASRFCRPIGFEPLRDHPGARVTLAHLGWPWTDEAIALGLIDRINGVPENACAFRFDLSFGPPPPYRHEVLAKALEVLGPGLLQFGSDCFLPCPGAEIAERRGWLRDLLAEFDLDAAALERIWAGSAAAWLGIDANAVPSRACADAGGGARMHVADHADSPRHRAARRKNGWLGARPYSLSCC